MFQYPKMSSILSSCVKVEHSFEFLNGGRCHFCNNWSVPELVSAIERVEWPCNLQSRGISIVLGHVVVFAERSCPLLGLNEPCNEGSRPFSFVFFGAEAADWNCVSWISATVSPNCFGRRSMRIRMCVSWIRVSELCARIALLARCFIQSTTIRGGGSRRSITLSTCAVPGTTCKRSTRCRNNWPTSTPLWPICRIVCTSCKPCSGPCRRNSQVTDTFKFTTRFYSSEFHSFIYRSIALELLYRKPFGSNFIRSVV